MLEIKSNVYGTGEIHEVPVGGMSPLSGEAYYPQYVGPRNETKVLYDEKMAQEVTLDHRGNVAVDGRSRSRGSGTRAFQGRMMVSTMRPHSSCMYLRTSMIIAKHKATMNIEEKAVQRVAT